MNYPQFVKLEAEVVAVAPSSLERADGYSKEHGLPFPCLGDPEHRVFDSYNVESKMASLGQRPALFVIDKQGLVRYAHVGSQQWDIPPMEELLHAVEKAGAGRSRSEA